MKFVLADDLSRVSHSIFVKHRRRIAEMIPDANIDHIGATSVPGALTKGDVDLLVRVEEAQFSDAKSILKDAYDTHQLHNWTDSLASFKDDTEELPLGVQLIVAGTEIEAYLIGFRNLLLRDPSALKQYNAMKHAHEGADPDAYREAKTALMFQLLKSSK